MIHHVLPRSRRPRSAWKNGGGTTEEVVSWPEGSSLSDFAWRVSIADVTHPGPFSVFEGVERIIVVIDGVGLRLEVDDVHNTLVPMRPFAFSGDSVTSARLIDGPTRDINVMARRGLVSADVTVVAVSDRAPQYAQVMTEEELVVVVVQGDVTVRGTAPSPTDAKVIGSRRAHPAWVATHLTLFDALHQRGPSSIEVSGDGTVAVIRVTPLASSSATPLEVE